MPRFAALLTIHLCVGAAEKSQSLETQNQCEALSDDCVDGYTSLLQDSLHLQQVNAHRDPQKLATMPRRRGDILEVLSAASEESARSGKRGSSRSDAGQARGKAPVAQQSGDSLGSFMEDAELHSHISSLAWIAFLGVAVFICGAAGYFLSVGLTEHVARYNATAGSRGLRGVASVGPASAGQALLVDVSADDEIELRKHNEMDEDTYSLAIALIVRDLTDLSKMEKGHKDKKLKISRIMFACLLALLTSVLEISLVVCTKKFVTPQQVAAIRDAYDNYEATMYTQTYINKNGKNRGVYGTFNASAFATLDDDDAGDICNIPMSQPLFICVVLVVWSITCFAQIKSSVENFMALLFFAHNVDSMQDALEERKDENSDNEDEDDDPEDRKSLVIVGLTPIVKVLLTIFIFFPDLGTASYVLWLGSRWLLATNDFGNLISNAVALEFILQLKCLLYLALVSDRNKRDLNNTGLAPPWEREPAGYGVYFNSLTWATLAMVWVWLYVYHFQQVLPDYHWDVHTVCTPWLNSQLSS